MQEAAALVPAQQSSPVLEPALRQLLAVWKARWPSADAASPDAALTVHHVRCILLEALQPRIRSQVMTEQQLQQGLFHGPAHASYSLLWGPGSPPDTSFAHEQLVFQVCVKVGNAKTGAICYSICSRLHRLLRS